MTNARMTSSRVTKVYARRKHSRKLGSEKERRHYCAPTNKHTYRGESGGEREFITLCSKVQHKSSNNTQNYVVVTYEHCIYIYVYTLNIYICSVYMYSSPLCACMWKRKHFWVSINYCRIQTPTKKPGSRSRRRRRKAAFLRAYNTEYLRKRE